MKAAETGYIVNCWKLNGNGSEGVKKLKKKKKEFGFFCFVLFFILFGLCVMLHKTCPPQCSSHEDQN